MPYPLGHRAVRSKVCMVRGKELHVLNMLSEERAAERTDLCVVPEINIYFKIRTALVLLQQRMKIVLLLA